MGLICSELSAMYEAAVQLGPQGGNLVAQVAASLPPPKVRGRDQRTCLQAACCGRACKGEAEPCCLRCRASKLLLPS